MTELLMRHLATTELKLNAHLVTFSEEVFSVDDFDLVVVRVDTNTEFQLLHLATLLVLVSFLLVLFLHVLVFAVIDNFTHWRIGGSSDFDEVKAALFSHAQRHRGDEYAILLIRHAIDHPDLRSANAFIDASLVNITTILWATILTSLTWTVEVAT